MVDQAGRLEPTGRMVASTRGIPTEHRSHQIVRTEYSLIDSSFVTKSRPSATAWAIRIRSNGDRRSEDPSATTRTRGATTATRPQLHPTYVLDQCRYRECGRRGRMRRNGVARRALSRSIAAAIYAREFAERRQYPNTPAIPVPSSSSDAGSGVGDGDESAGVKSNVNAKPAFAAPVTGPPLENPSAAAPTRRRYTPGESSPVNARLPPSLFRPNAVGIEKSKSRPRPAGRIN